MLVLTSIKGFEISINRVSIDLDNNFYVSIPGEDIGKPHYLDENGVLRTRATYFPNIKTCINVIDKHFIEKS